MNSFKNVQVLNPHCQGLNEFVFFLLWLDLQCLIDSLPSLSSEQTAHTPSSLPVSAWCEYISYLSVRPFIINYQTIIAHWKASLTKSNIIYNLHTPINNTALEMKINTNRNPNTYLYFIGKSKSKLLKHWNINNSKQ